MNWLKANWRWAALNMFAALTMVYVLTQGSLDMSNTRTFDPMLESGKWAIRFLLFSLAMSPLNTYLGWRSAIKLRKPAGLWAFGFAAWHFLLLITDRNYGNFSWLTPPLQPFIVFGLTGLIILSAMAITSNQWAMQRLGKRWKRLHRLVYIAGGAVVYHAILATSTKKMYFRDPHAINELQIYLVIMTILLAVRIPVIRDQLKRLKRITLVPRAVGQE